MCTKCDHFIHSSKFDYTTLDEWEYLMSCIDHREKIHNILISGGECTLHPNFEDIIRSVRGHFPDSGLRIFTNGSMLDTINIEILDMIGEIIITDYGEWNKDVIEKYRNRGNVALTDRSRGDESFSNPFRKNTCSEDAAKWVRNKCLHQVRIVGTKLYGCCISEGVARYHTQEDIGILFTKNWREDFFNLPTWKACQHCYRGCEDVHYQNWLIQTGQEDM